MSASSWVPDWVSWATTAAVEPLVCFDGESRTGGTSTGGAPPPRLPVKAAANATAVAAASGPVPPSENPGHERDEMSVSHIRYAPQRSQVRCRADSCNTATYECQNPNIPKYIQVHKRTITCTYIYSHIYIPTRPYTYISICITHTYTYTHMFACKPISQYIYIHRANLSAVAAKRISECIFSQGGMMCSKRRLLPM